MLEFLKMHFLKNFIPMKQRNSLTRKYAKLTKKELLSSYFTVSWPTTCYIYSASVILRFENFHHFRC